MIQVHCYREADSAAHEVRDTFRGPLHRQIEGALALITRELGREIVLVGAYRQEVPRLPADVVREALSNAVGHRRDDLTGHRILVQLRPDRVIVTSTGGLVEGVRLDRLRAAQAAPTTPSSRSCAPSPSPRTAAGASTSLPARTSP